MQIGIYYRGSFFPSCLHHGMKLWFFYPKNLFSFRSSPLIHIWFEPGCLIKISSLFNIVALPIIQESANINCVFGFSEGKREREVKETMRTQLVLNSCRWIRLLQSVEMVCSNSKIWCVRYHRLTSNFLLLWGICFNYISLFILPTTVSSLR